MQSESSQVELTRLRREQSQARQNEVFGGLSTEERVDYEIKAGRIHELEHEVMIEAEAWEPRSSRVR